MTPCVIWTGATNRQGYGRVQHEGRSWLAHRLAWTQAHGPIPKGMCVLHTCDNPPCMNVEHLWLGTRADNNRDMAAKGRGRKPLKKCARGHDLTGANRTPPDANGNSCCRTCKVEKQRERRART